MCPQGSENSRPADRDSRAAGGSVRAMDEQVLYHVIRKAVEDALLGVIGRSYWSAWPSWSSGSA